MPDWVLVLVLLITLLPYWYIYHQYKRSVVKDSMYYEFHPYYNLNVIRNVALVMVIGWTILCFSGYGVMGTSSVRATSSPIALVRALFFKLAISPWALVYILSAKSRKNVLIFVIFVLLSSVSRHSLGGIYYLALWLLYKYYDSVLVYCKRHYMQIILLLISAPLIISTLYNARSYMRTGVGISESSSNDIILGKLCGRISSFSNNAQILEYYPVLLANADNIPPLFYMYDPLHFFGYRPEFESTGRYVNEEVRNGRNENYSIMPGVGGVIVMSMVKSPIIVVINILYMLIAIKIIFWLTRIMRIQNHAGVALFCTIGFATSGDSSELSNYIYGLIFIWIILNLIGRKKYAKVQN